ncbi:MAG: hypothetical protein GY842_02650, partial [bacterium]|nr:hypothetical protein [bacterium]
NWWGCNDGPGNTGCDNVVMGTGPVDADPWLVLGLSADPMEVPMGGTSTLTADMTDNSDGVDSGGWVPDGTSVAFGTAAGGVGPSPVPAASGIALSTFTAPAAVGFVDVTATLDNETVTVSIEVIDPPTPLIELTKTVGTTAGVCAATDSITVNSGTEVTYCYHVENTGDVAFAFHDLEDDQLGTLLANFPHILLPGGVYEHLET